MKKGLYYLRNFTLNSDMIPNLGANFKYHINLKIDQLVERRKSEIFYMGLRGDLIYGRSRLRSKPKLQ